MYILQNTLDDVLISSIVVLEVEVFGTQLIETEIIREDLSI